MTGRAAYQVVFRDAEGRYRASLQRLPLQWVLDGNRGGWTCPSYVPENAKRLVRAPPAGDATEMPQKLFDDPMKVTVRLGPSVCPAPTASR